MLDDNDLLDFPASSLAMSDAGDARGLLHEHGEVFRAQLVTARWLEGWLARMKQHIERDSIAAMPWTPERLAGFEEAVLDVVAHLRQGDFLATGPLYQDEISGKNDPRPKTD